MPPPVAPSAASPSPRLDELLRETLLLDLEVSHQGRILKVGAVLGNRALARAGSFTPAATLAELAELAKSSRCVLGHNLVRHDLRVLRETVPDHPLLRLPVLDTLVLSPLAFPENPYHRLVKDYRLVRESVSDPVADARQAARLFRDEFASFAGLRQTEPALFELLQVLLTTPDAEADAEPLARGMAMFFDALDGIRTTPARALTVCWDWFRRWGCARVPVDESDLQTAAQRLALAYTVTWLRVAGSNSVLPPWVRLEHPLTGQWIRRLREVPCGAKDCAYCRRVHDAREQLRAFFAFDDFRPEPRNADGGSLQRDIVEAGLRDSSVLALLPTGGGKSLCFQLPALVRNFRRGVLTIIISPLQALMKDQVDGLARRTGTPFAAALYGLLTPPERGDVLRRIRLGDVALLYVSPEQLRNRSFREAIAQREIGCWVFDEAHCLSKWGHDFRPDYLYAGRFIREFSEKNGGAIPPIACFTATAKREVREEIVAFFMAETGRELALYEGGVERDNLRFEVQTITGPTKLERIQDLLADRLARGRAGSAIVFRTRRGATEVTAEFLRAKGWSAAHFHAGLTAPEKKRTQDEFLSGQTQVICATNAFGMGIDKEDVRLVIHADIPGSIENYLQEAGRAGRDGGMAECVLLFDEEDCEHQFRLEAFSELSRKDIAQILRGLRKAARRGGRDEVVITAGEILRDEEVETDIDLEDRGADTKVRTAVSWLERAGFLQRDENVTQVFQARPLVRDLAEAEARMAPLNLSAREQALWTAILRELINANANESLTVDRLALLPEFASCTPWEPPDALRDAPRGANRQPAGQGERPRETPERGAHRASPEYVSARVLKTLGSMARAGLLKRDTLLDALVRHNVVDHSGLRLSRVLELDRRLVDLLATEAPDPEGWMPLALRPLNQRLCDEGSDSSVEAIRSLLKSLSEDGRGFAGTHGSLELRFVSRDFYRVRVRRSWTAIGELAEKRRRVAELVLDTLLAKIPAGTPARADLRLDFSLEELQDAVDRDLLLRAELKDRDAALARALLYLHEQQVIGLQHGLAVFRSAMTIRLPPEAKREQYSTGDYQPLAHHYRERILQVHVMSEYARRGLQAIREALSLVLAYFTLGKEEFVRRFLTSKPALLEHATTARSFQCIVTDLANRAQVRIVTAPADRNLLILAGPGSGKTRTVVHRCAYLLRVERVRPQSVLVCCFNRHAALELRRRLADLAGADARGVTVLTYHALAMRLLGYSFSARAERRGTELDFDGLINDAVKLLRGETAVPGCEPDEVRERLLTGFQHILVDEYQDIDEPQYELVSAIAGRTLKDADQRLSILAVGDDDQNIYTFRGANVEFIRRFQRDYDAEVHYLVENYRSSRHIIEAANAFIAANTDRMKLEHPIGIDRHRQRLPAGGDFAARDALAKGRVQVIRAPDDLGQALAVVAEIRRLRDLGGSDWSSFAVLSSTHRELRLVRALAEREGIPVRWCPARNTMPSLHHIREIRAFLRKLHGRRGELSRGTALRALAGPPLSAGSTNPWTRLLHRFLDAWLAESSDAELPVQEAIEFFYESCAESRRDFSYGEGVTLNTVHAAKGTEFDHVLLIGAWPLPAPRAELEEARRAFYVGMTRARRTLAVLDRSDVRPSLPPSLDGPAILRRDSAAVLPSTDLSSPRYAMLSLEDLYLSYAAGFEPGHPIHAALAATQPGDRLKLRRFHRGLGLFDSGDVCVARLSRKGESTWASRLDAVLEVRVVALVARSAQQEADAGRRERCQVPEWEIPLVEIVFAAEQGAFEHVPEAGDEL